MIENRKKLIVLPPVATELCNPKINYNHITDLGNTFRSTNNHKIQQIYPNSDQTKILNGMIIGEKMTEILHYGHYLFLGSVSR